MIRKTNQQAVIYCRVSTKKQAREGNGLGSQETRCREYAKHRGHQVVGVFTDDVSGKLAQRPGFDDMLASIPKAAKPEWSTSSTTSDETSEETTSELQPLMSMTSGVFCLKKKKYRIQAHKLFNLQIQMKNQDT